jgi:hypothetical protein
MTLSLGRSVRSLWSPFVMICGLVFSLLGMVMVTMPAEPGVTRPTYVSGIVIGAVCALLGLPFMWGGARMGVFRTGDAVKSGSYLAPRSPTTRMRSKVSPWARRSTIPCP